MQSATSEREREIQDTRSEDKARMHRAYSMTRLLDLQFAQVHQHLSPSQNVLEIGCGLGEMIDYLDRRPIAGLRYLGIDLSPECIARARERIPAERTDAIRVATGDASNPDDPALAGGGPFDAAVMRGVVHHLEDPGSVFANVARQLRPGSELLILEGNVSSRYRRTALGIADLLGIQHEASQFPHQPAEITAEQLAAAGFTQIRIGYLEGVLAPLAYTGLGGRRLWTALGPLERIGRLAPKLFGWWYFLRAARSAQGGV